MWWGTVGTGTAVLLWRGRYDYTDVSTQMGIYYTGVLYILFKDLFLFMCVCVSVYIDVCGGQKTTLGPLELELEEIVSHQKWVLETRTNIL